MPNTTQHVAQPVLGVSVVLHQAGTLSVLLLRRVAYNWSHMSGFSYKPTSKLRAFFATRGVIGWTPWQRRKRQVVLEGYSLDFDQATRLEAYLREHSIIAFVCPSIQDEDTFSVAVWHKDHKRALAMLANGPIHPQA